MTRQRKWEEILWPRAFKCLCCDCLSEGELLCTECQRELRGMRLSGYYAANEHIRSSFRYEGRSKQLVLLLKMECVAAAAHVLAKQIAEDAKDFVLPPDTVLTWVTMPKRRIRQRGIDHGQLLCKAIAARLNMPARQLITRKGRIRTQRGLNREERLLNLKDTIVCTERITTPVLLVDDVLTTGTTVSACAEALMAAGAPKVYVITATKVMLHPND